MIQFMLRIIIEGEILQRVHALFRFDLTNVLHVFSTAQQILFLNLLSYFYLQKPTNSMKILIDTFTIKKKICSNQQD